MADSVEVMMVAAVDSVEVIIKFSVCFDGGHCGWFSGSMVLIGVLMDSLEVMIVALARFGRSCSGSV